MKKIRLRRIGLRKILRRVATNYLEHHVGKNAAALAYYMLFALFPLLIFCSNLLGLLDLNVHAIVHSLEQFLPREVVGIVRAFLDHISQSSNHTLLWFSLVFSVWFPMRAVQGLMDDIRRAYGLKNPEKPLAFVLRQVVFTGIFLVSVGLTLLLSTMGKEVLEAINRLLPEGSVQVSGYLLWLWQYLRFVPAVGLMFLTIGVLYAGSLDRRARVRTILPGVFLAVFSWLLVNVGFSFYVENFAHYSVIYGTLGAVIVLLIWLYLTALVLILGAEFNAALQAVRSEQLQEEAPQAVLAEN